jgi:hypothetical protein
MMTASTQRSIIGEILAQIQTTLYTQISNGEPYKRTGCPVEAILERKEFIKG